MTPRAALLLDIVLGASAWGAVIACGYWIVEWSR